MEGRCEWCNCYSGNLMTNRVTCGGYVRNFTVCSQKCLEEASSVWERDVNREIQRRQERIREADAAYDEAKENMDALKKEMDAYVLTDATELNNDLKEIVSLLKNTELPFTQSDDVYLDREENLVFNYKEKKLSNIGKDLSFFISKERLFIQHMKKAGRSLNTVAVMTGNSDMVAPETSDRKIPLESLVIFFEEKKAQDAEVEKTVSELRKLYELRKNCAEEIKTNVTNARKKVKLIFGIISSIVASILFKIFFYSNNEESIGLNVFCSLLWGAGLGFGVGGPVLGGFVNLVVLGHYYKKYGVPVEKRFAEEAGVSEGKQEAAGEKN